ncbi:MAG: TatD family hydrolase [Anaerolineae bacterium]|nr:TatD family hydrolase [Anaerolineae bacterium]
MLVDTHCHLNLVQFDADREAVLDRARAAGVERVVVIGIDRATNREVVELAERHSEVYAVVGYHPNSADEFDAQALDQLRHDLRHPRVVALGEIGLDFYWDRQPREVQAEVFQAQLDLAVDLGQPIVVHIRSRPEPGHDAHTATWDILQPWAARHPWRGTGRPLGVLHCFSGDAALADAALQAGFYVGVDGPLTYKNGKALQALAQTWPLDRVVIETDAPYLPPHPHRGQRNEPAYVRLVAEKLAELHGLSLDKVALTTTEAAERLFGLHVAQTLDREPMAHE